jgi:hypothetical protein
MIVLHNHGRNYSGRGKFMPPGKFMPQHLFKIF